MQPSESRLRALVKDAYIETLVRAVTGGLGGKGGGARDGVVPFIH